MNDNWRWLAMAMLVGLEIVPCFGQAQPQPDRKLLYRGGLPIPVPGSNGAFYAQMTDGSIGTTHLQVGPGKLLYLKGLPIPVPDHSGAFYAQMPDGSVGMTTLP